MQIGWRLFYLKTTGEIVGACGERSVDVVETPIEVDMLKYVPAMEGVEVNLEDVDYIQLQHGELSPELAEVILTLTVDVNTKTLIIPEMEV